MSGRKILFVLTGHDRLGPAGDNSADKTGFHLAEAAKPWAVLSDAGFTIDLFTPSGGAAPIDPSSKAMDDEDNERFLADERVSAQIVDARPLYEADLGDYEAIYFPGGHGTMWDLPENEVVQHAIRTMYEDGKVVAAVCHGPAAFVNVRLSDGKWFVDGRTLSAFTDAEEKSVDKDDVMPFLLAGKLKERGATMNRADKFKKSVSIDGRIVTGQNPASARGVGEGIRNRVAERLAEAA